MKKISYVILCATWQNVKYGNLHCIDIHKDPFVMKKLNRFLRKLCFVQVGSCCFLSHNITTYFFIKG